MNTIRLIIRKFSIVFTTPIFLRVMLLLLLLPTLYFLNILKKGRSKLNNFLTFSEFGAFGDQGPIRRAVFEIINQLPAASKKYVATFGGCTLE